MNENAYLIFIGGTGSASEAGALQAYGGMTGVNKWKNLVGACEFDFMAWPGGLAYDAWDNGGSRMWWLLAEKLYGTKNKNRELVIIAFSHGSTVAVLGLERLFAYKHDARGRVTMISLAAPIIKSYKQRAVGISRYLKDWIFITDPFDDIRDGLVNVQDPIIPGAKSYPGVKQCAELVAESGLRGMAAHDIMPKNDITREALKKYLDESPPWDI